MTTARDRQTTCHIFGLNALHPQDGQCHVSHPNPLFTLIVLSDLLKHRRGSLNSIEYNGLLRVALTVRQEINTPHVMTELNADEAEHWLTMIDSVLDQAFIPFPQPYVNVCTYQSDSDDNTSLMPAQQEAV